MMHKRYIIALAAVFCLLICAGASAKNTDVTFTVGGDVLLGGNAAKKTDQRFDQYFMTYGPTYSLKNYIPLFSGDDVTLLNLEAPLKMSSNPYTRNNRHDPMHGKPEYVKILTASSIEAVNVTNNHINDYNTKKDTLKILDDNGIKQSDSSFSPYSNSLVVNGVRVGFLGYRMPCKLSQVRKDIKKARAKCDIVVVSFHFCGVEAYSPVVTKSQISAAHAAVNAGADMVCGHHPHVVSGIEKYKGKYIFYDLGSLVSSGKNFRPNNIVARITLCVDAETGAVESGVPTVYPGCASGAGKNQPNNCQPILWREGDAEYESVFAAIDKYSAQKGITAGEYIRGK